MQGNKNFRAVALAVIKKQNKLLVFKAQDSVKQHDFYRPLGGGVEFGETSAEALKREIKEELNTEIKNLKLIKVLENIFTYEGEMGHEIVFLYQADFKDQKMYDKESMPIIDSKEDRVASWVEINELNKSNFYPDGIKNLL